MKFSLKSNGFTLIEILISIVILSVSLLALAALMATTTQNTSSGGHITEAATYAQDQLEQLRETSWASIANNWVDPSGAATRTGPSGITYTRTLNVVTSGSLKTITITVTWNDRMDHAFSLISAISEL